MYTGMWDAKVDRVPMLALSGQVDTQVVGTGAFQEVDLVAGFEAVAPFNHRVQRDSKHAELMTLAVKNAVLRREVSHLTFPDEVQVHPVGDEVPAGTLENRITPLEIHPPQDMLDKAVGMIQKAQRPAIIMGHGARFHKEAIIKLAETLNCAVFTTFKGKGLISDQHELGCGVLGRSGTPIASWFMNEADLLLVFGASFSNHTGITAKIPTIQVDFDPMSLAKFHSIDCMLYGELGVTVAAIRKALPEGTSAPDQRAEIAERWAIWRAEKQRRLLDDKGKGVSSIAIFEAMNRHVPGNAVIAVDVGNNTYSFGRYFECTDQAVLMSGYLGSIGFGYPAAMGAWAAAPDRPIFAVTGDGGFGQYMAELNTAVMYNMPIKHVLLNNSELGKISKEQRTAQLDVWKTTLSNPNFADYANSCGALGIRVTDASQLDEALAKALAHDGPAMVEVMADSSLI
ncbi:MAG: thiamine pyrophosphate-binding protein [Bacteroidota bacterium]